MQHCLSNLTPPWSRQQSHGRHQNGFTLLELMVVMLIATILLSIAVVSYQSMIERSQTSEASSNLRMNLTFSRGEAIKRGGWVGFCGSENGTSCSSSVQKGWLVFHDADRDRILNNDDTVLSFTRQSHSSLTVSLEELSALSSDSVIFNYRGYPDRPILLRASKGEANEGFALLASGRIESR